MANKKIKDGSLVWFTKFQNLEYEYFDSKKVWDFGKN